GVGCRAPASTCDLDHLIDHAKGGKTVRVNLDPACRHDHRVKHEGGWTLTQIQHGHRWTTRLGHTYTVPTPPVIPGAPLPASERDHLGRPWQNSALWHPDPPAPPPTPAPEPAPARSDPAEEPPF
ncbi:MAG: HNH endonuclease signature motif containing protein, partial [Sporichthyaceae bacterium]